MSTLTYNVFTREELIQELNNRIFPRQLIILKNPNAYNFVIKQTLRTLNKYVVYTRYYDLPVAGNMIDTSPVAMPNLHGIGVRRVTSVVAGNLLESFIDIWRNFRTTPNFFVNLYRFDDNFKEFTAAEQLFKQINKRWNNRATSYQFFPSENKIIVNADVWKGYQSACIEFIPDFDTNADEWEMYDNEFQFLADMTYAEMLNREAAAKSESISMGLETNYQLLLDESNRIKTETLEEWSKNIIYLSTKRF